MTFDTELFFILNNLAGRSDFFDNLIIFCGEYLPYFLILVFAALIFFSSRAPREKFYIFSVSLASAVVAREAFAEIIRSLYHRPRPFLTLEVNQLFTNDGWAFPSGHATFFFALATALYFYDKKWGYWFFAGAFLVSISRVIAGIHYPGDILGGLLLGALVSILGRALAQKEFIKKLFKV